MPYSPMTDRAKLAREITARTEPRFIEIKAEPRRKLRATFIEIPSQRGGGRVPLTEEQLTAMRGSFFDRINFSHLGTDHLRGR